MALGVQFSHSKAGTLVVENGVDQANWGYNLNTANFPTYGGEVIQILSVYINDLTLSGTVTTYYQLEAIYSYFANYMQIATQGPNAVPDVNTGTAYNVEPVVFTYPARNWSLQIYPLAAPGFKYGLETITPQWQMQAHVIDDSPDYSIDNIKDAIANSVLDQGITILNKMNGEISPNSGNPETDPFQTYDQSAQALSTSVKQSGEYYDSLISSYTQGDFSALTGGLGSGPANSPKGSTLPG